MPVLTFFIIFGTSFVVGLSGAMTPGPLLMVGITETARRGFWAGPSLALGHSLLELVMVALLLAGLSQFLQTGMMAALVGVLGGFFLLWMGQRIVRGARHLSISVYGRDASPRWDNRTPPSSVALQGDNPVILPAKEGLSVIPFMAGVWASLSNPYWLVWWATVGASYMVWSLQEGPFGVSSFYVGHILADFAWYSLISFVVATGRRVVSDTLYRGVLVACGVFLLVLGVYFIYSGAGFMRALYFN